MVSVGEASGSVPLRPGPQRARSRPAPSAPPGIDARLVPGLVIYVGYPL